MKLSEALRGGVPVDLQRLSLPRYGYSGRLDDSPELVQWLESHPLIDIEINPTTAPLMTSTPVRSEQAAFRDAVFEAYEGQCAITGCNEETVLDAAHLRSWRVGNTVNDGILLRADLHRLLDANKLVIDQSYRVRILSPAYAELATTDLRLRLPRRRQDWPKL
jgi:hypothetical protein